jgi:septum formation protein
MTLPPVSLVLASASPRRSELLSRLGVPFFVRPADVDEALEPGLDLPPSAHALRIAERKALAVTAQDSDIILAADTLVVAPDGRLLGKPVDAEDARCILGTLSGSVHEVVTGVYLRREADGLVVAGAETTRVTMRELDPAEIDAYVATGESCGKAGAYAIQ